MKKPHPDFGDSGVTLEYCDTQGCGKRLGLLSDGTVTVAWKGRYGVYCSNTHLKETEKGDMNMVTSAQTTEATEAQSNPIEAGASTPKKAKKGKTAAKPVKAAKVKTAKAAKATNGKSHFTDDQKIKLAKDFDPDNFKGIRHELTKRLTTGMTVADYVEKTNNEKCRKAGRSFLKILADKGLVTVS